MQIRYSFESSDSLAQFSVWIFPMVAGGIGGYFFFAVGGWLGVLAGGLVGAALIAGLRASIVVTDVEVVIRKKWFFVPYRTYRAPEIADVWFGGDWGLEEGAMGVIVKLGQKEIHIGTSKNMHALHDALLPLSSSYRAPVVPPKPLHSGMGGKMRHTLPMTKKSPAQISRVVKTYFAKIFPRPPRNLERFTALCSAVFIGMVSSLCAAETSPNRCEQVYQQASSRQAFPERQSAIQYMEGARSECLADGLYLSRLASFYLEFGRVDESDRIVAEALALHPMNRELLFSKGNSELRQYKPANAANTAEKLIQAHPSWFASYYLMQRAKMDLRQFSESLKYGQRAVELSKDAIPVIFLNLAVANYHAGQLEECVRMTEIAIQKDPSVLSKPWGINEAIYALATLERRPEALSLAKRRKNADPNWQADPTLVKALRVMGVIQ